MRINLHFAHALIQVCTLTDLLDIRCGQLQHACVALFTRDCRFDDVDVPLSCVGLRLDLEGELNTALAW